MLNKRTVCTSILNTDVYYVTANYYRSDAKYKDGLYINIESRRLLYFHDREVRKKGMYETKESLLTSHIKGRGTKICRAKRTAAVPRGNRWPAPKQNIRPFRFGAQQVVWLVGWSVSFLVGWCCFPWLIPPGSFLFAAMAFALRALSGSNREPRIKNSTPTSRGRFEK